MGCLRTAVLLVACCVGGAMLINADPNLPGQVIAGGASAERWVAGALSTPAGHSTVQPSPVLDAPPTPVPSSAPIVVITPQPTSPRPAVALSPPPVTPFTWSQLDIDYATNELLTDRYLDTKAESTYPAEAAFYASIAAQWTVLLGQIHDAEHGQPPRAAAIAQAEAWFTLAIQSHRNDTAAHPANATWNDGWIATYQHLAALWYSL